MTAEGIIPAATSSGSRTSMRVTSPVGSDASFFTSLYGMLPLDDHVVSLLRDGKELWKGRTEENEGSLVAVNSVGST